MSYWEWAKLTATSLGISYHHHSYCFRDLVVALEVTVTQIAAYVGKPGKSNMNYGVPCDPIPAALRASASIETGARMWSPVACYAASVLLSGRYCRSYAAEDGHASGPCTRLALEAG